MKAVILNSLEVEDELNSIINQKLTKLGYGSKLFNLKERNIVPCTGCDYCFEQEVGVCCKQDGMQEIYPELANSELYIFITQISFGGFNSDLKKAIDRFMPLIMPTYTIHKGELHHPLRYNNPKKLINIGFLKEGFKEQGSTFRLVTKRLEKAFFLSRAYTVVAKNTSNNSLLEKKIKKGLDEMGCRIDD